MEKERISKVGLIGLPITWLNDKHVTFPLISNDAVQMVRVKGLLAHNSEFDPNASVKIYGVINKGVLNASGMVVNPSEKRSVRKLLNKTNMSTFSIVEYMKRTGPTMAAGENETLVIEGTAYRMFVLSDRNGNPTGYRLREIPIDKMKDYTNAYEDFDVFEQEGKSAFETALEKFNAGNAEYDKIIEQAALNNIYR